MPWVQILILTSWQETPPRSALSHGLVSVRFFRPSISITRRGSLLSQPRRPLPPHLVCRSRLDWFTLTTHHTVTRGVVDLSHVTTSTSDYILAGISPRHRSRRLMQALAPYTLEVFGPLLRAGVDDSGVYDPHSWDFRCRGTRQVLLTAGDV